MTTPDQDHALGHRLTALVCMVSLVAGFGWALWSLDHARIDAQALRPHAWLDGSAGRVLGKSLRLPAQGAIDTANAAVRYRLLGDLGDQTALGCPQWMFYRDGLRPQPGVAADVLRERVRLMRYWTGELRAKHIEVLVVAVPDKSRIEAAHLCGRAVSQGMRQRLDEWQDALRDEGVPFVDLRATLEGHTEPMFFRTDVHMNADGARAAATAVAQAALPLLGNQRGTQEFSIGKPGAPQVRIGDLLVLSGLQRAPRGWRPDLERVQPQDIEPVRSGGLLDAAPPVEVLLAGSSNGRRSNFAPWLGIGLGREVWNLSMDGGQFSGALIAALKQRERWPNSLRLVIWEFSENALSLPLTDDEKAVLAHLPARQDVPRPPQAAASAARAFAPSA
ncbi:alginate O-acetyltransferase AlgX-related protein [Trinickia diaoshuihuensis]|uniref:alginate O-acetyltransferase AlgX-related protein n=1 Tax=Trinickia diaoshuihuensis TaxID=2292265 RepID=UPI001F0816E3|nr:cell division protein FtsQ [Trinickia diaoshuihuensis]